MHTRIANLCSKRQRKMQFLPISGQSMRAAALPACCAHGSETLAHHVDAWVLQGEGPGHDLAAGDLRGRAAVP